MNKKQAKKLFAKYVNNECSDKERKLLEAFLESYQDIHGKWPKAIVGSKKAFEKSSWLKIDAKINKKKRSHSFDPYFKYAAIFVVFLGLAYLYRQGTFTKPNEQLIISEETITLQLESGMIEVINEGGTRQIRDEQGNVIGVQKGNQLIYDNNSVTTEKLVYNTLKVPYGKRFQVKLSDGTLVNINAGSSLKYPINFIKGQKRQVFIEGEMYFNVVKDSEHPFVVTANDIDVQVLGTQFNISSFPEDDKINTVLVEGAVSIFDKPSSSRTNLKPGFLASWDKTTKSMVVEEADIGMHTAWIDGRIIFRHISFDNVIKKLERYYNVSIVNNDSELGKRILAASFDIETIQEVFDAFREYYGIDYTISDNKIIIN
ncbi:FecR family protein [Snuella sedimenti]|uniref:FecR domain-containing protein n=1 Tax=Snuella sedimenti TaxID=2798802 RepID=A0A8J7LNC0_9FLAO|nr:FecR domain-containing protein [Snuella sedimenti]MBJ6368604.1 FecR domain-containing protein [Snuella sedimenti]